MPSPLDYFAAEFAELLAEVCREAIPKVIAFLANVVNLPGNVFWHVESNVARVIPIGIIGEGFTTRPEQPIKVGAVGIAVANPINGATFGVGESQLIHFQSSRVVGHFL